MELIIVVSVEAVEVVGDYGRALEQWQREASGGRLL